MRPRRKILLWSWDKDPHPARNEDLIFVLQTMLPVYIASYRIGVNELERLAAERDWDGILILHLGSELTTQRAVRAARKYGWPVMVVALAENCPLTNSPTHPYGASREELLDRIRLLCAKKRGPKSARPAAVSEEVA